MKYLKNQLLLGALDKGQKKTGWVFVVSRKVYVHTKSPRLATNPEAVLFCMDFAVRATGTKLSGDMPPVTVFKSSALKRFTH